MPNVVGHYQRKCWQFLLLSWYFDDKSTIASSYTSYIANRPTTVLKPFNHPNNPGCKS